jgi:hypothetical protein
MALSPQDIQQRLLDAARLRPPRPNRTLTIAEQVAELEDWMMGAALHRSLLHEARVELYAVVRDLETQWRARYPKFAPDTMKGRASVDDAGRTLALAIVDARFLIRRCVEGLEECEAARATASRDFTFLTGGS